MNLTDNEYDFFKTTSSVKNKNGNNNKNRVWIRAKEGVSIYNLSRSTLIRIAKEAGALYKINATLMIDKNTLDQYLESFKIQGEA